MPTETLLLAVIRALARAQDSGPVEAWKAIQAARALLEKASLSIREAAFAKMG